MKFTARQKIVVLAFCAFLATLICFSTEPDTQLSAKSTEPDTQLSAKSGPALTDFRIKALHNNTKRTTQPTFSDKSVSRSNISSEEPLVQNETAHVRFMQVKVSTLEKNRSAKTDWIPIGEISRFDQWIKHHSSFRKREKDNSLTRSLIEEKLYAIIHDKPRAPQEKSTTTTVPLVRNGTYTIQESDGVYFSVNLTNGKMPPVQVDTFNYIATPTQVCQGVAPMILAFAYTTQKNFKGRMLLRKTWAANTKIFPKELIQTIFVVGRDKQETETSRKALLKEAKLFGDMLYVNFTDSYTNLTYKVVIAMKFITTNCPKAKYIVKTDDDTLVNVPALRNELEKYKPSSLNVLGKLNHYMPVIRDSKGKLRKWYVDPKEYPVKSPDIFPTYVSGGGWAMTYAAFAQLYSRVPHEPWLYIEDAYTTGVLAQQVQGIAYHWINVAVGYKQSMKLPNLKNVTFFMNIPEKVQIEAIWTRLKLPFLRKI